MPSVLALRNCRGIDRLAHASRDGFSDSSQSRLAILITNMGTLVANRGTFQKAKILQRLLLVVSCLILLSTRAGADDTAWRADGYHFLDARRVDVDGSAMQAILLAYPRFFKEHHNNQTPSSHYVVDSLKAADNSYVVRFVPYVNLPVPTVTHFDYHISENDIGAPPQPHNSAPISPFQSSVSLLDADMAAFMSGYHEWRLYKTKKKLNLQDVAAQAVGISQFLYFGRLQYGISFVYKWYVPATFGCDYSVRIDPETDKPIGEIGVVC